MADALAHRKDIVKALADLLRSNDFEDITVQEICTQAHISRQTFYRCFESKYEAANWYADQLVDVTCRQIGIKFGFRDGYLRFFLLLSHNKEFCQAISAIRGVESLYSTTMRTSREDYTAAYRHRHGKDPDELIAFQIRYFSQVATMAITDWQSEGYQPPADIFIDRFITLVPHELFAALDMPTEEPDQSLIFTA